MAASAARSTAIRERKGGPIRVAVIGLGAGTLACQSAPGENWTFFEIDQTMVDTARDPKYFTYINSCEPNMVGLTTYRNARQTVAATLSNLSEFCDVICAIDDRSTDGSVFEVRRWPKLGALIMLDADISTKPWHFSEDILYEALYRMAEPFHPDWVIQLDADETLEPANSVRPLLQCVPCEVRSFVVRRVSIWTDTRYPDMVPLLGTGTSVTRCVWRFAPGLKPQLKRLHNSRSPYFDDPPEKYLCASSIVVKHSGWNT